MDRSQSNIRGRKLGEIQDHYASFQENAKHTFESIGTYPRLPSLLWGAEISGEASRRFNISAEMSP